MLRASYILLFLLLVLCGLAQQQFPPVKGTTLDEKKVSIPQDNGKYTVVAIAFHKDAEGSLKNWLNPLYDSFIKKENGDSFDVSEWFDVNFIFIPLIQGFRRVADEFKKNTDPMFWPYVLDTEKTDVKALQEKLGVKDNTHPHFYILDKQGRVIRSVSGAYSQEKLALLEDAIE